MNRLKEIITPKIASEVLNKNIVKVDLDLKSVEPVIAYSSDGYGFRNISVFEFADKCKKFVINKYKYNIDSGYTISVNGDVMSYGIAFDVINESEDFTCFNKEEVVSIIECVKYIIMKNQYF